LIERVEDFRTGFPGGGKMKVAVDRTRAYATRFRFPVCCDEIVFIERKQIQAGREMIPDDFDRLPGRHPEIIQKARICELYHYLNKPVTWVSIPSLIDSQITVGIPVRI
jgi:hypothetical protein